MPVGSVCAADSSRGSLAIVPVMPVETVTPVKSGKKGAEEMGFPPVTGGASGGDGEPLVQCSMDCGFVGPANQLDNMYNERYPRYICRPCNSARRALDRQFLRKKELKDWLKEFKSRDPEGYKAKVRQCSLSVGPLDHGARSGGKFAVRSAKILSFVNEASQFVSVQEVGEVVWLRRGQFLAHMKNVEGLTEEQAVAKWEQDLASGQCFRAQSWHWP